MWGISHPRPVTGRAGPGISQGVPTARALRPVLTTAALLVLSAITPVAGATDDPAGGVEIEALSTSQCGTGRFCLWSGTNFSGAFWSTSALGTQSTVIGTARSVWNRMGVDVQTFSGAAATGSAQCFGAGAQTGSANAPSVSIRTMDPTTC